MIDSYYDKLNENIRYTDEISFKLLGLVPLFSGSGALLAVLKSEYFWSSAIYVIAAFGALVTLGLFRWELRNIQTCLWLIARGADVEQAENEKKPGQFYQRTKPPMGVGKTKAEKFIYGATIFIWLLLPWLVYSTAQVKTSSAPPLNQTLNSIYIAFGVVTGIFTVASVIMPVKYEPEPPKPPSK